MTTRSIEAKEELLSALNGAHEEYLPTGADILIATYFPPEKVGGIYLPDRTRGENEYQGRVGLVLKVGPMVNSEKIDEIFGGKLPMVGDWVVFRGSDTYTFKLNKVPCRAIEATYIRAIISNPDLIF